MAFTNIDNNQVYLEYKKIMRQDLVVAEQVDIYKSAENVWNALTDHEIIKKYLFGPETTTAQQVGSEIIFTGLYGRNNEHSNRDKGVII